MATLEVGHTEDISPQAAHHLHQEAQLSTLEASPPSGTRPTIGPHPILTF
jgi:hypothetical protein